MKLQGVPLGCHQGTIHLLWMNGTSKKAKSKHFKVEMCARSEWSAILVIVRGGRKLMKIINTQSSRQTFSARAPLVCTHRAMHSELMKPAVHCLECAKISIVGIRLHQECVDKTWKDLKAFFHRIRISEYVESCLFESVRFRALSR